MPEMMIATDAIDPPEFNSRIGYQTDDLSKEEDVKLRELAKTMESEGQLQAIEVELIQDGTLHPSLRYVLVYGSRRLRAAKLLKWPTIRANVVPARKPVDRILVNALENLQREDLTTYEQGRLCAELRKLGLTGPDCAARLGFSKQKVSNYAICFERLPVAVKAAWRDGHPAAAMEGLREIATLKTEAEMTAAWDERVALQQQADSIILGVEEDEDDDGPDGDDDEDASNGKATTKKPKGDYKVSRELHKHVINALRAKRALPGAGLAAQVADFLVGKVDNVRGLTSRKSFDEASTGKKVKAATLKAFKEQVKGDPF